MGDYFKPWIRQAGAVVVAGICLFSMVYSIRPFLKGGGLKFHLEATERAIEFGVDRTRNGIGDLPPVDLLSCSITYRSIAIVAAILLVLVLVGQRRKRQPKFESVRVDTSLANGPKTGRGKRLCLEQINLHLRNIHNIWLHRGFRR